MSATNFSGSPYHHGFLPWVVNDGASSRNLATVACLLTRVAALGNHTRQHSTGPVLPSMARPNGNYYSPWVLNDATAKKNQDTIERLHAQVATFGTGQSVTGSPGQTAIAPWQFTPFPLSSCWCLAQVSSTSIPASGAVPRYAEVDKRSLVSNSDSTPFMQPVFGIPTGGNDNAS